MAEIVNLRMARKRKRRTLAAEAASEARVRHGRTAAEKAESRLAREFEDRSLDGHRRDRPRD